MPGRKGQRSGGHNAKTTAEHHRDGTFQKCRHEKRADNGDAKGYPEKPANLTKIQSKLWDEMVGFLPDGVVGGADTMALRELCNWYQQYISAMELWKECPIDKHARLSACAAWDRFWRIAQEFGCSPVARTRLQQHEGDGEKANPLAGLHALLESRN